MKITNRQNLPAPLVNAITFSNRDREGCAFTITELLRPPRIVALERKHEAEVTEDAADRIWALLGSLGHEVLRRSAKSGIVEERAVIEIDGLKIGGQVDYCVTDTTLWDYKFTSVYAVQEGPRREWVEQLNCYMYMLAQYGVPIKELTIVAILRDWSLPESLRHPDYPQSQVKVLNLPKWPFDATEYFIRQRISMHTAARSALPDCTGEDMWERPEVWAVKKNASAARAVRLHSNEGEARFHALKIGGWIEHRLGERPRCEQYCPVSQFCEQYKQWKELKNETVT